MNLLLSTEEWIALKLSATVAFWCVVTIMLPGIAIAWLLARKQFWGKMIVDALVHLPLVLPPVVTGYILLVLFGSRGVIGQWLKESFGLDLAFTWKAAVMASAVMAFPLLVRTVRLSLELVDRRLEEAAMTLGANRAWTFLTITLPLASPGILAGLILAFARSLGEFGATVTFAGNTEGETRTLPLAVYTYAQSLEGDEAALRLVGISILFSLGALMISEWLARSLKRLLSTSEEGR